MTIKVVTHVEDGLGAVRKTVEIESAADWKYFQELIHRGSNLWPDAPAQIKRLADIVTSGKVMQDYGPDQS